MDHKKIFGMEEKKATAGLNQFTKIDHFTEDERRILRRFSSEWYVTNGGGIIELGLTSSYKYFLIKPVASYQELFNIEREIVVVFSNYESFEPRSLDSFDFVNTKFQDLRIDKICSVLISKDINIESKIRNLLKTGTEYQIVVPFYFNELLENHDAYLIRNRFKDHFYNRDLFAFESALKKDLYFFGRNDLVHKIVSRHRSGENSGLFGLRKTGKTSIIFGIQRVLKAQEELSVYIDCQDTSFYLKRWNKALKYIIDEIKTQNNIVVLISDNDNYTEDNASKAFEKDILKLHKKCNCKRILIIFDEVERITFEIASADHWKKGNDFIYFWQSLRALFQRLPDIFTYLIVSTNPKAVETSTMNGIDNPIFAQIPFEYIPPFEVYQVREMVRRLGRIMGLNFDETIYAKLAEDFGGHPFLIRNVCSAINKICPKERPVRIDRTLYDKGKDLFNQDYKPYIEMILNVLKEYYNDEFEMLKFLALDDIATFNEFAKISKQYTNHLLGYNIIDKNLDSYSFKIESVKQYLVEINKYKRVNLTNKEMYKEISERRNTLEPKLRNIIKTLLQAKYGESIAKSIVLDIFGNGRKNKYNALSYKDIFNPNKTEIYFEDLKKIITKEWSVFEYIFGRDKEGFNVCMTAINKYRIDAHAKDITSEEMEYFRVCISKIEKYIYDYLN